MTINVSELLAKVPTGLLIGDSWVEASDGGTFDVENQRRVKQSQRSRLLLPRMHWLLLMLHALFRPSGLGCQRASVLIFYAAVLSS